MTAVIDVRDLTKTYGGRVLLDGVQLSLREGEKVGLIGRNGSGKTTLLRVLAGHEGYDDGTIALRRHALVGYLPQDPELDLGRTVYETAAEDRARLRAEAPEWSWSHRVEATLTRLGLDRWDRRLDSLSGGERRRVALARTLLSEPDLLLLDEPTNHLDADTILWLEETLFDFAGSVLVATHDRYFLDRVVDRMLEVSQRTLNSYDGGYTAYLEARADREARERVEETKQLRFLKKELEWARRSPPARTGKQKARRRRAHELDAERRERAADRERNAELPLESGPRLGKRVLELHDLTYAHEGRTLIDRFSDRLRAGEKVGIVGPNGVGKTTLLRLLIGEERADGGSVVLGENTRIGYLDQNRTVDPDLSVERVVSDGDWVRVGDRPVHVRAYLDRFLFPPEVLRQKVGSLSGGERSRLLLARLLVQDFNLLVLDEPTNDLDLDTLRVLEDALESFAGCLVVVTHDRYLLDRLATTLWVFEGDGQVHRHDGSWDDYLARREARARAGSEGRPAKDERQAPTGGDLRSRSIRKGSRRDDGQEPEKRRLSYNEQRELEGMEERIAGLEAEMNQLSGLLGDPEFYQERAAGVSEVTSRYQELEAEIEALYERWTELDQRR